MISVGTLAAGGAHATPVVSANPSVISAGKAATITVNLRSDVNYVVSPYGFKVASWSAGCHDWYLTQRHFEVCSGTFSFTTTVAPAAPTGPNAYPFMVGYWYSPSRNRPSYSNPTPLAYLGDLYH